MPTANFDDCGNVGEVDDLGYVGRGETWRPRVAIDRYDAKVARARMLDRAALVAARADEEDGLHGRRWYFARTAAGARERSDSSGRYGSRSSS